MKTITIIIPDIISLTSPPPTTSQQDAAGTPPPSSSSPSSSSSSSSSFSLALFEGTESSALSFAVASRLGITNNNNENNKNVHFYLTISPDATDTVIPLSSSLPDQMKLYLHVLTVASPKSITITNKNKNEIQEMIETKNDNDNRSTTDNTTPQPSGKVPQNDIYIDDDDDDDNSGPIFFQENHNNRTPVIYNRNNNNKKKKNDKEEDEEETFQQKGFFSRARAVMFTDLLYNPFRTLHYIKSGTNNINNNNNTTSKDLVEGVTKDIYYFNQLGSDLANERTFLAWIRTMLACIRTIFAYEKIQTSGLRDESLVAAIMMTATMLLLTGILSMQRYYSTRKLLLSASDDKPKTYNMITLFPFVGLGFATAVVTSIATYTGNWWD